MGISLHKGPVGEPGGGSSLGIFERKQKYRVTTKTLLDFK
jgi:hypothetical protein